MVYNKIKNNNIIDEYPIPQTLNVSALNEAKLVHFPDETFVPLSKLDKFLNQTKEESNKSIKMKSPQRNDEEYRNKSVTVNPMDNTLYFITMKSIK